MGSEPIERATWLNVLEYCCAQENGGILIGAALWKDRQWQQSCGVTAREVKRTSRLLRVDGDDVVVLFYPKEKEAEVKAKREAGRRGGQRSGEARSQNTSSNPSSCASNETPSTASSFARTEGKGREGKGKEEKEKGEKESSSEDLTLCAESPQAASAPKRRSLAKLSDEDWLSSLAKDPTYAGIDVLREHGKMVQWCALKGKQPTRQRFLNWLNRIDRPMSSGRSGREQIPDAREGEW